MKPAITPICLLLLCAALLSACGPVSGREAIASSPAAAAATQGNGPTAVDSVRAADATGLGGDAGRATLPAPEQTEDASGNSRLLATLTAGASYASVRERLLGAGWQPVPSARCLENVVGADHALQCTSEPPLATCALCTELPELEACSGDGYCRMQFARKHQTIRVWTYGDASAWKDDPARLQFKGWGAADGADDRAQ